MDSGVSTSRLEIGVDVATNSAGPRQPRRVLLVDMTGPTLPVGEALITEGA